MKVRLGDIAVIQIGYSFRSRIESMKTGNVAVIQMKDLSDLNSVDGSSLVFVDMERPKDHHLIRPGDLIFRSRGLTSTSAILNDELGVAVVAAPLIKIRIVDQNILPEYLNWFISQSPAQTFFASHAKGTTQRMISKETLEELEVYVPSLDLQKAIIDIAALSEEEQLIMKKLADKRKHYIANELIRLAQGA